jgi:hypothetical protein
MPSMADDPLNHSFSELPSPPPELRERVLASCRREMGARLAAGQRTSRQRRWVLAAGVAALLLLNGVEEQRSSARIAAMTQGGARIAQAPRTGQPALGSLRARATLLAALLRDPNAL